MILDELAAHARERVAADKAKISLADMKAQAEALPQGDFRFEKALAGRDCAFICEVKKASPSKGIIDPVFDFEKIAQSYEQAGADCVSCLTEPKWFLGSDEIFKKVREIVTKPMIRKDFTVDEYQIYQAKVLGADAVLLICTLLDTETIRDYIGICDKLGISALVETHDAQEMQSAVRAGARLIGVNNRNLKDFTVDLGNAARLREGAPDGTIFVAESGVSAPADAAALRKTGADAVLVGEYLMRAADQETGARCPAGGGKMKLKFCGLTRKEDIEAANETKPDFIGFVFAESRRHVSDMDAARLKEHLDPEIKAVGVFVNDEPEHIAALVRDEVIDIIQLHGGESLHYINKLRKLTSAPIVYAVRVETHRDIEQADKLPVDYLLLDTYVKHAYGGSGKTFDWSLIGEVDHPYFLAGGLNESNVQKAAQTGAYALDLSSGIETDDVKDIDKMRRVSALVKGANQ